jgi:hypothetical protein
MKPLFTYRSTIWQTIVRGHAYNKIIIIIACIILCIMFVENEFDGLTLDDEYPFEILKRRIEDAYSKQ